MPNAAPARKIVRMRLLKALFIRTAAVFDAAQLEWCMKGFGGEVHVLAKSSNSQ